MRRKTKPNRISFNKGDICADGKIPLELFTASQNNRETNEAGVGPLRTPKEASQDNKGADISVTPVKKPPRAESDLFTVRSSKFSSEMPSPTIIIKSARFESQREELRRRRKQNNCYKTN